MGFLAGLNLCWMLTGRKEGGNCDAQKQPLNNQDFSKILVVLGFEIQGKIGTPIRLMAKLIGLRIQCVPMLPFRSSWSWPKFCPGKSLFLGGEGAAPSPK